MQEKEIQRLHEKTDIPKKTLRMIDRGMKEAKKGNVSGPVDIEEDFPSLFEGDVSKPRD